MIAELFADGGVPAMNALMAGFVANEHPVPDNMPIEGWPGPKGSGSARLSLDDVQRDRQNQGGDRHAIVVDPINRILYSASWEEGLLAMKLEAAKSP